MKRAIATAAVAAATFIAPAAQAFYGALAIDSNQGDQAGASWGWPSAFEASKAALHWCGEGCRIVRTFANVCEAYAADQQSGSSVFAVGQSYTRMGAENNALLYCQQHGGTACVVRVWGCSTHGVPGGAGNR